MVPDTSPRTAVIIGTCYDICDRKASFKNLVELMGGSVPRPCGPFPKHLVGWRESRLSGNLYVGMLLQFKSSFVDRTKGRSPNDANVNLVSKARLARSDLWHEFFGQPPDYSVIRNCSLWAIVSDNCYEAGSPFSKPICSQNFSSCLSERRPKSDSDKFAMHHDVPPCSEVSPANHRCVIILT